MVISKKLYDLIWRINSYDFLEITDAFLYDICSVWFCSITAIIYFLKICFKNIYNCCDSISKKNNLLFSVVVFKSF